MPSHVALLRAVNLAGHNMVPMAELRDLLARLGFQDVRSLLQSGNLVFRSGSRRGASIEALLEGETARRLGLATDFFVRSAAEWKRLVARNPFPKEAAEDPRRFAVMFLKGAPAARDVEALRAAITGRERFRADGRQLYAVFPDGFARTRFTTALIEKKLATRCTCRNWNTVLKLQACVDEP
jgi:uncharacterized protein (DUF1697 family)